MDINIENTEVALPTNIMYYIAIDAGVGQRFKNLYFKAVEMGMGAYTKSTLGYVVKQLNNPVLGHLLKDRVEQQHIKDKLNYATNLIKKYHVQVTPSFLINQTTLLEGEDVIDSLIGVSNDE